MIYKFLKEYQTAVTFTLLSLIVSFNFFISRSIKIKFIGIFFVVLLLVTSFSNDYMFNKTSINISSNVKKSISAILDIIVGIVALIFIYSFFM